MLQKYLGNGNSSISDLFNTAYPGPGSSTDGYYNVLSGSGSMSDKQYANTSGGIAVGSPIDALMATTPFYIGHRGQGDVVPEHTYEGYMAAVSAGMKAIEVSTQVSSDNWWFCLHDAGATGLDRTTDGTGDPKTKTQAQLLALKVDINNCGPYWVAQNLRIPALSTVLSALVNTNNKVVFLESKDYTTTAIDALLVYLNANFSAKQKSNIIWKSHVTGAYGLAAARAAGMKCWAYIDYPLVAQQVTDAQARADYIGIPRYDGGTGLTDGEVDTVIAGIGAVKAISWQPVRRSEMAKLLAKGVDGFVCPQGRYALDNLPNRSQDDFASGKWAPGDIPFDSSRNFVLDSGTAWFNTTATNPSVVMGSLSPSGPYFEIEYEFKYDTVPAATLGSGIAFSKPDDQRYQFQLAGNPSGGYHTLLRQNGQLQLYSHIAGSASGTQLGSTIATAVLNNTDWAKIRVRVDSNGIQLQRMDGTPSTVITSTDSVNRGSYFHLSRNHAAATNETVRFRNIKVTAL
jgi:glycerophosphoryl diester phosphodiesterase